MRVDADIIDERGRVVCADESDTIRFGGRVAACLRPGDVVLLFGEMGAGKSVIARAIGRALGVDAPMPSPTFTVMIPYTGRVPVIHFDLYRLEDEDAFFAAGLGENIGGVNICLIEWPDRFLPLFNNAARVIEIRVDYGNEERERVIEYSMIERP